jgi:hypothetical protein
MSKLLPQLELGEWGQRLGGAKQMVQRASTPLNIGNTLMLGGVWFSSSDFAQQVFGSIWAFYSLLAFLALSYVAFDYIVLFPAEQSFAQHQANTTARNPAMRLLEDIDARTREMAEDEDSPSK